MKSLSRHIPLVVLLGSLAAAVPAQAQEFKAGFVNTDRIFREANTAKAAQAKLEQEFSRREKELVDMGNSLKSATEKFEREAPTMAESQRTARQRQLVDQDREFQRKRREFQEDLGARKNEELGQVLERANRVVKQVAEQEKYDVILQEAVYINPKHDITGSSIGGARKITLNAEAIAPFPGAGNDRTLRMFTFLDVGNVFGDRPTSGFLTVSDEAWKASKKWRASAGVGISWISPLGPLRLAPQLGGTREVGIRVGRHDVGAALAGLLSQRGCHNDAGRLGGGQLLLVTGVAEKAQIARAGGFQGSDACNTCFARRPLEFATKRIDDLP